jgi:hypothetical protein
MMLAVLSLIRSQTPSSYLAERGRAKQLAAGFGRIASPVEQNAERAPWNSRVRFVTAERSRARAASASPELGPFLLGGRYRVRVELGRSPLKTVGF